MKKLIRDAFIICFTVAAATAYAGPAQNDKGEWFNYKTENFSVSFPSKPSVGSMVVKNDEGVYNGIAIGMEGKSAAYILSCVEFDAQPGLALDELPEVLESKREGTVLDKKVISLQGFDGREYTIRNSKGTLIHRTYIVNKLLYQLAVQTRRGKVDRRNIDRFFESFQIARPEKKDLFARLHS